MRAARILQAIAEDPNPRAAEQLRSRLEQTASPATPIQLTSDTNRLKTLRVVLAKFKEKERIEALSREARMLRDPEAGVLKIRIVRPRAQLMSDERTVREAYAALTVECDSRLATGRLLKEAILRKQVTVIFKCASFFVFGVALSFCRSRSRCLKYHSTLCASFCMNLAAAIIPLS